MSIEQIKKGDELTQSLDIVNDNITRLKELFPEVFTEGKIDFKVLQDILGDEIETEEEYYRFTWAGKAQARREAHKPSTGTLRPAKEESVNWDTTENLYIEGDNLEVLKLLQKSYSNKVKMIYIDPPYNTGKDFVYKDNYKDNLKNYQQITGQIDDEGNKLSTNSDSDGRFHSNWLNMMYPRLKLARNLLNEDGIIFISIDDNEVDNLKKLCDEIFGETNFISNLVWQKKTGASDSVTISTITENILVYCKNLNFTSNLFSKNTESFDITRYRSKDEYVEERGLYYSDNLDRGGLQYSDSLNFGIECPDGTIAFPNGRSSFKNDGWIWKWSKAKIEWARENNFIEFKKSDKKASGWSVYYKNYLFVDNENNKIERSAPHKNLITSILNASSASDMKKLFDERVFQYTKPVDLLKHLISLVKFNNKDIIIDFFSGSATTAHAIMQLNIEDGVSRKYIQVQLPEPTDEKSEAFKAGYNTITEIGKERIRRASKKIAEVNPDKVKELDLGFKVFKLDSSNIKGWDGNPDNLEQSLFDSQDNIKTDRTEEDVLFEILLKYGLDLTLPIEEKIIEGKKVFNVGFGALFICLADGITNKVAEGIGAWKQETNPESCRAIFKDTGFTDVEKTNAVQTLKRFGIHEIKSI